MGLGFEMFINWVVDNLPNSAIADLCEAADNASELAIKMVDENPLGGPYVPELIADDLAYRLPDLIGAFTHHSTDDGGTRQWFATRDEENGSKVYRGDTELLAIASLLREETGRD